MKHKELKQIFSILGDSKEDRELKQGFIDIIELQNKQPKERFLIVNSDNYKKLSDLKSF